MNKTIQNLQVSLIREAYRLAKPTSVDLGLGQIDLSPVKSTIDDCKNALDNPLNYRYTATQGDEELRDLIANQFNTRNGTSYNSDNVLVTAGATGALTVGFMTFLGESRDNVVIPEISYPTYSIVPEMIGQGRYEVRRFKLRDDFSPDLLDLEDKLDERSLLVLNFPSNPTGAIVSPNNLEKIALMVKENNAFAISDEVYSQIYFGEAPQSLSQYAPGQVMVIDSLSKSGLIPGLRIGWSISPIEITQQATKAHQFMNSCVSSVSQEAAKSVLRESGQFEELRGHLSGNRELLANFLDSKNLRFSNGGIYCFVDTREYGSSLEVSKALLSEVDVVTIPGKAFGDKGDEYVRMSFGVNTESLMEGIKRMEGFF